MWSLLHRFGKEFFLSDFSVCVGVNLIRNLLKSNISIYYLLNRNDDLNALNLICFGPLYEGDVMCQNDSQWIVKPECHFEDIMIRSFLGWSKYDVTDGQGVKYTARHCCRY